MLTVVHDTGMIVGNLLKLVYVSRQALLETIQDFSQARQCGVSAIRGQTVRHMQGAYGVHMRRQRGTDTPRHRQTLSNEQCGLVWGISQSG